MPTITYPGIYVEEIPGGPKPIPGVDTSSAAFVGHAVKAPRYGCPVAIASLQEFEQLLGGPAPGFRLHAALRAWFANGGGRAIVLPVGPCDPESTDPAPLRRGLARIGREAGPSLLLVPDALRLSRGDYHEIVRAMLRQCARRRDRFAILDVHGGDSAAARSVADSAPLLADFRAVVAPLGKALSWGAVYYPWLVDSSGGVEPPSPAVAGLYAQTDQHRGVWKAPAGTGASLVDVADLTVNYRDSDREALDAPPDGPAVNAIRKFSGQGVLVWGGRTLDAHNSEFRYVPVRRLGIFIEQSVRKGLQALVFEPNEPATWSAARGMIERFLIEMWRQGALFGTTPKDAFYVACGHGTTMTNDDLLAGRLIVEVGFAPLRPAEFISLRFRQRVTALE